jgi:hypothetical protein
MREDRPRVHKKKRSSRLITPTTAEPTRDGADGQKTPYKHKFCPFAPRFTAHRCRIPIATTS